MSNVRLKIGALASGRGTNLQAIIDSIKKGYLQTEIAVVISNKKDAPALERASKEGIDTVYVDPSAFKDRTAYDVEILDILKRYRVDLVVLAGYMRIVTGPLIDAYKNRIMNVHPALLPSFPGMSAQRQALEYGVKIAGCTVHFVEEGVDKGPIIAQAAVPVLEGDTEESLSARILKEEHKLFPQAIKLYEEGRVSISGRRVAINLRGRG
ncbi:MAG TPA: phosphoribosylglycinamide formyltransferase [Nitrospiria bacterium]|nr:phosphoribosylglycinamide formyltransferase [Nitrospiria bacterium]